MRQIAKDVLVELAKWDYLFKMKDGHWFIAGRIAVDEDSCEELFLDGYIELSHGNQDYEAYQISEWGQIYLYSSD